MAITAQQVNELRQKTGVSMMACKKALVEADGNMEAAIDILRKKGEAKAGQKAERATKEGVVQIAKEGNKAALASVFCETDFVARNEELVALVKDIAQKAVSEGEGSAKSFAETGLKELFNKLGENLQLGELQIIEGPVVGSYVHSNNKLAAVVVLDGGEEEIATDLAMHVTAMNPQVIDPSEVSDEMVAKEKEVWTEQLKNEGKPENIIEKILIGKETKFREESALIKQPFVKDGEKTVEQLLDGGKVVSFERVAI